ncbi:ABC transporter permease [Demequina aurantiaca]|uniref:ABC transporter permease n=1 Tax=Demequina aurantiaca TaxID=676200 RepID=UPI0007856E07|nr:ABC transporter permease [Demequina aurantiaca]
MKAMILKEFRELRRDKRTMAMLIALPILLLVIFGYAANFTIDDISTRVVGPGSEQVTAQLPDLFDVDADAAAAAQDTDGDTQTALDLVRDNKADVAIDTTTSPPTAYIDGSNLFSAQTAKGALAQMPDGAVTIDVLYNPDLTTAWVMVPALIGLILTFIGTIITSIGLVRERQNGTLEQLAVMPLKPSDVIVGKIAPYFILAALDMIIVTLLGVWIFDVPFNGNVALFGFGGAIFLFVVLGLGVLISTASQTQAQAIQVAMMILLPQILLSGFIFPLSAMPAAISWIGYILPLTYWVNISQGILLRGADLASLWPSFAVLAVMAVVIFTAAVLRFRRDLAPSSRRKSQKSSKAGN